MRMNVHFHGTARTTLRHRSGAFTLVELLVVIVIIAMMAGLILPAVTGMNERANVVVCTSNLKQLSHAMLAFAADHEGRCPLNENNTSSTMFGIQKPNWIQGASITGSNGVLSISTGSLWPYVKDTKVYACRSRPNRELVRSYSMAGYFSGADDAKTRTVPAFNKIQHQRAQKFIEAERPSQTMMLTEENPPDYPPQDGRTFLNDGYFAHEDPHREMPASYHSADPFTLLNGKDNVCFVDGHVELLSPQMASRAFESFFHDVATTAAGQ
jgi:prepilin-type N-terminal cleavage/methylation domain-containing protein/prepilin-type processing-associated H-X9-DG protein